MKKISVSLIAISLMLIASVSCKTMKSEAAAPASAICPVCKMKVNTSEGFSEVYNGKTYYFDNIDCKKSFKMNPAQFAGK